jgi:hypothetical protein
MVIKRHLRQILIFLFLKEQVVIQSLKRFSYCNPCKILENFFEDKAHRKILNNPIEAQCLSMDKN